jgi:hypothetical protein
MEALSAEQNRRAKLSDGEQCDRNERGQSKSQRGGSDAVIILSDA